ncbi:MAG: tryptophan--tRNA ligase [Saprospiraceae bacterium]|nr:tryptophan--tRNA ligase [Saprospiraceae bacterium]MDZ4704093.1 tryptophan--tRNA ligase [Saprospiraceae bacterium]
MDHKKTVLSCIQPTGDMHFGNYFGAVKNWVDLQANYECFYGVVNYHAMTMPYNPQKMREVTWEFIINLLAVGVKPEYLFIQSLVPEHTELSWIFNCFTSYGQLTRMTQFKDKSAQSETLAEGFISAGLFDYPVLQAADILIYRADYVPVGKDQDQHLELTRNIAQRFNNQVGKEFFVLPEPLYTETPIIRSPADPAKKMSKSAGEKHYINVFGEEAVIRKQVKTAVTDTGDTPAGEMSAGVKNLFELLRASGGLEAHASLTEDYRAGNLKYSLLKEAVADALVAVSTPFRERKAELSGKKKEVEEMVKASSAEIRKRAQETVREVKELAGLINV